MKQFLTVLAAIIVMISCTRQAENKSASNPEEVMGAANKGGKKAATLISTSLPTLFITASVSGADVTWSGLPDTVHVTQIAFCDNNTFLNTDTTTKVANLYLQNPVTSTSNYVTSFTVPSNWFSGTKFARIQGDYYNGNNSGLYFSNTFTITLP